MEVCRSVFIFIQKSQCHSKMVTDFALVDLKVFGGFLAPHPQSDTLSQHHYIVSLSKDKLNKFYSLKLIKSFATQQKLVFKSSSAELKLVRVYNNLCTIYAQNGLNVVRKMSLDPEELLILNLMYIINWQSYYFDRLNLWHDKVICCI